MKLYLWCGICFLILSSCASYSPNHGELITHASELARAASQYDDKKVVVDGCLVKSKRYINRKLKGYLYLRSRKSIIPKSPDPEPEDPVYSTRSITVEPSRGFRRWLSKIDDDDVNGIHVIIEGKFDATRERVQGAIGVQENRGTLQNAKIRQAVIDEDDYTKC